MIPAVDISQLSPAAQKILDPAGPAAMKQLAARAIAPGVRPGDAITVCALLTESTDAVIADLAKKTIAKLPAPILNGALSGDLPPGVIALVAPHYANDGEIAGKLLRLPSIQPDTVADLAGRANEAVSELIATNEELLLAHPAIIEKLYMNKATRMSTADRILELAVRNKLVLSGIPAFEAAAQAIANELIPEATDEPTFDDVRFKDCEELARRHGEDDDDTHEIDEMTGEERVKQKYKERHSAFQDLNVSGKIRRALVGDSKDRLLAVRDPNPLVREAAVKAPGLNEAEVERITRNRNTGEDVLRIIATDRDWTRTYQIKKNLVENPRTPFAFASRLIAHLRESDLKKLSQSRDVSGAVGNALKQHLSRKGK